MTAETGRSDGGSPASEAAEEKSPPASVSPSVYAELSIPAGIPEAVERLEIREKLSYGVLYEGRVFQASRGRSVCLLELDPVFERDPEGLTTLLSQLFWAGKLRHPSILSPRGVFRHAESLYALFDGHSGVSLATGFEFLGRNGLRLSPDGVLRIASSVLAALDEVARQDEPEEAGLCHGLVTPENVFVAEGQRVFLRGFGLWRARIHRTGLLGVAERRYLAPIQNRGITASPRTDLLSLATILFEAAVGAPAFDSAPEEEDFVELRNSIEELRLSQPPLREVLDVVLSCLAAPSAVTAAYRGRLRTSIDTLFLREFASERPRGSLSLEELVTRVKPRRPVIVKATPLALAPAEPPAAAEEPEPAPTAPQQAPPAPVAPPPLVETVSPVAPEPSFSLRRVRAPRIPPALAGGLVTALAVVLVLVLRSPRPERRPGAARPLPDPGSATFRLATAVPLPTTGPPNAVRTPPPLAIAAARPMAVRVLPAPRVRTSATESRPRERASRVEKRREPAPLSPGTPKIQPVERQPSAPPPDPTGSVVAGSLVALGTPGLLRPVVAEAPTAPTFGEGDSRPASERSALLELLVDEEGFVRENRILRVERIPAGFAKSVADYLTDLRFRPARLEGVPVRVWIPYELRYRSP
jgi:hypothetical protein